MTISFLNFCILALACFRLTRLIVFDKITVFLRAPFFDEYEEVTIEGEIEVYYLPKKKGIQKFLGELLSCYWCTGIWTATFIIAANYFFSKISEPFILILALAGAASIIETIIQRFTDN